MVSLFEAGKREARVPSVRRVFLLWTLRCFAASRCQRCACSCEAEAFEALSQNARGQVLLVAGSMDRLTAGVAAPHKSAK